MKTFFQTVGIVAVSVLPILLATVIVTGELIGWVRTIDYWQQACSLGIRALAGQ